MGHRVHPKAYRIKEITDWDSRWLSKKKFPQYLREDFEIREFLEKKSADWSVESIEIERFTGRVNIIINTARPGLIIGRGGQGLEDLKKKIEALLKPKEKIEIKLDIKEVKDPWTKARLASHYIAQQIEKRIPPRRVLKQALEKIMVHKEVKGARVEVAGRLGGAEIARREWLKKGQLPRQTIRADIDYAQARAHCTYGTIGVKVWIYKGEKI